MQSKEDFNSHPRVGGDGKLHVLEFSGRISIRTPAWGVTNGIPASVLAENFNSHPRVGGDDAAARAAEYTAISIRTPAWGVTGAC